MNCLVLMASPRKNGNTASLLAPFTREILNHGHTVNTISLYEREILPCIACRSCQRDWSIFGCVHQDDMQEVFDAILQSDLIILATPIYSWYCTPPLKAALDRLVYGMNKFYGEEKGPSIWAGKKLALVVTCGYRPENGADLFCEGIRRYCKHSKLDYLGMYAARDLGYSSVFMDEAKSQGAASFARELCEKLK